MPVSRSRLGVLALLASALLLGACERPESVAENSMPVTDIAEDLQRVADKRIVFAHQSVGNDILSGITAMARRSQQQIEIVEGREAPADWHGIVHFKVGTNGDPQAKIRDFVQTLENGSLQSADVAVLKLCYIDFDSSTDVEGLAQQYGDAIEQLQAKYPDTRVVATTAPLTTIQTGPKAWVKRLLGRTPSGYEDNYRRHLFNERLRARFDEARLFDLARAEAAASQGGHTFEFNSQQIEAMNPALTYDGGHLNERGQEAVSSAFLDFIAELPTEERS